MSATISHHCPEAQAYRALLSQVAAEGLSGPVRARIRLALREGPARAKKVGNWRITFGEVARNVALMAKVRTPEELLIERVVGAVYGERFIAKGSANARKSARKAAERALAAIAEFLETERPWQ